MFKKNIGILGALMISISASLNTAHAADQDFGPLAVKCDFHFPASSEEAAEDVKIRILTDVKFTLEETSETGPMSSVAVFANPASDDMSFSAVSGLLSLNENAQSFISQTKFSRTTITLSKTSGRSRLVQEALDGGHWVSRESLGTCTEIQYASVGSHN